MKSSDSHRGIPERDLAVRGGGNNQNTITENIVDFSFVVCHPGKRFQLLGCGNNTALVDKTNRSQSNIPLEEGP